MPRKIVATVDAEGRVTLDLHGFKGAECEKVTQDLEQALGTVRQRQRKPEFYQERVSQQAQQSQPSQLRMRGT